MLTNLSFICKKGWRGLCTNMQVGGDRVAYQIQRANLVFLYSFKVPMDVKLGKDNYLITSVGTCMADDNECIDMALREQAQGNVGER